MAVTKIANVIVPELFAPYVINKTAEISTLINSGIVTANPALNALISGGGATIQMPHWNDLSGNSEVLSESASLTAQNITAAKEIAPVLYRGKAFGATELSGCMAGDDPMRAIGNLIAEWWNRDEQTTLINVLNGVFQATGMSSLVSDITSTQSAAISANAVLDAKQLLGDAANKLSGIAMHSATYTKLQKDNVIAFIPASDSKVQIPTYLGYRVIVNDNLPYVNPGKAAYTITIGGTYAATETVTADSVTYTVAAGDTSNDLIAKGLKAALDADATFSGKFATYINGAVITCIQKTAGTGSQPSVSKSSTSGTVAAATITDGTGNGMYTTYLFAAGSIGRGEGTPASLTPVETDRDSLASTDYLIHRRALVLHPQGMKWTGTPSGATPSNSELANGSNWAKVADTKQFGIVKLVHTL